jgi:hypothetical protein
MKWALLIGRSHHRYIFQGGVVKRDENLISSWFLPSWIDLEKE